MAAYLNKVELIGNLGRNPEVRYRQDGRRVVTFTLATSESWKDKTTHERRSRVEWHRIVILNERLIDSAEKLRKGNKVYLVGQKHTRSYQDNLGRDHSITEIILDSLRGELVALTEDPSSRTKGLPDPGPSVRHIDEEEFPF